MVLPCLEPASIYTEKAGAEILAQMWEAGPAGQREGTLLGEASPGSPLERAREASQLSLRPEGTATLQELARACKGRLKEVRLFYITRCWRYETPQAGRYREFTQFGVEVLQPRGEPQELSEELITLGERMLRACTSAELSVDKGVKRGLAYYTAEGWEARCPCLGAQGQVLGGGPYPEGIGFAIGVDRLALTIE